MRGALLFKTMLTFAVLQATTIHAAVYCTETVQKAILHSNGNVYFTTDQTCQNWCQINWGTELKNRNALALLLAAASSGRKVAFYWQSASSCGTQNPQYASPDYIELIGY